MYIMNYIFVNISIYQLFTATLVGTTMGVLMSCCRAFITWLANADTIRVFKMVKKEDGSFTFKAAPEDFPQKHRGSILNIGIAETGIAL